MKVIPFAGNCILCVTFLDLRWVASNCEKLEEAVEPAEVKISSSI
jgi:hypothetical protein